MQRDGRQRPLGQHLLEPACRDIFPYREFGLNRQTEPRPQGRRERIGIVGAQRAARCDHRLVTTGVRKTPDFGRRQVGAAETLMIGEFGWMGRAASPVEIRWCPDDKAANLTQSARNQGRIRQSGDPQGHVESAADEVDDFVTQMDIDHHFRIEAQELGQDRRHMSETK